MMNASGGIPSTTTPLQQNMATKRYDIRCDRETWHNTTLHCTLKEAIGYAHRLRDDAIGQINVMTITPDNHYVVVHTV